MAAVHINKEAFLKKVWNYEESPQRWKFRGDKPAIVNFYATWCGPCKMLAPILDEFAEEYAGKIDGQPQMMQGALLKASFKEIMDKHLTLIR